MHRYTPLFSKCLSLPQKGPKTDILPELVVGNIIKGLLVRMLLSESPRPVAESRIASAPAYGLGYLLLRAIEAWIRQSPGQCHMLRDEQWKLRPRVTNFGRSCII